MNGTTTEKAGGTGRTSWNALYLKSSSHIMDLDAPPFASQKIRLMSFMDSQRFFNVVTVFNGLRVTVAICLFGLFCLFVCLVFLLVCFLLFVCLFVLFVCVRGLAFELQWL